MFRRRADDKPIFEPMAIQFTEIPYQTIVNETVNNESKSKIIMFNCEGNIVKMLQAQTYLFH